MQISNIKTSISKNFLQSEFYSGSPDASEFHYLNDKIVPLAQYLRDYFDTPIKVNSTFRTKYHNKLFNIHDKTLIFSFNSLFRVCYVCY